MGHTRRHKGKGTWLSVAMSCVSVPRQQCAYQSPNADSPNPPRSTELPFFLSSNQLELLQSLERKFPRWPPQLLLSIPVEVGGPRSQSSQVSAVRESYPFDPKEQPPQVKKGETRDDLLRREAQERKEEDLDLGIGVRESKDAYQAEDGSAGAETPAERRGPLRGDDSGRYVLY